MKKLFLFALTFAFGVTVMAQNETKKVDASKKLAVKEQKASQAKIANSSAPATETKLQPPAIPAQTGPTPDDVMKVNTTEHNFGKIKQGVARSIGDFFANI